MMQGLKKRTRKAFGIRRKEKDNDSTTPLMWTMRGSVSNQENKEEISFHLVKTFSSSESEGEEEHGKKFKIKIKPLTTSSGNCTVSTMDELKASVGTLAISPSPLVGEEIARPRRSTPTPTTTPDPSRDNTTGFFSPPFETNFEAQNSEVFMAETELWCQSTSLSTCVLSRSLPTGGYYSVVPSVRDGSSSVYHGTPLSDQATGVLMPDLDSVFGPVETPKSGSDIIQCSWVSFSEGSPARPPPPDEPAPSPPMSSSSPEESPTSSSPSSPINLPPPASPPPPLLSIPPPDSPPPPPPSDSPLSPPDIPCCFHLPESEFPQESPVTPASPEMPFPPLDHPLSSIPCPVALREDSRRTPDPPWIREELCIFSTSPKDLGAVSFRGTPPPLPPPTYRSVMGSPGPYSGPSSPARSGTPVSSGSPIPPLPPRPSSRPKLPPGKPNITDARPFSPPIHSWSPPPFAPLARAESTSSISSLNSLSAASTPTLGREHNLSVSVCSRGPSPLTMGPQDTLPVAAAFTETISAYFKGADPTKCLVKITGEMVLSFPAGITRHFSSHPSPPVLTFNISRYSRLEQVLPNPQLLDTAAPTSGSKEFWVNMPNLLSHLKKVAEQRPQATYYNVDMLKYQVSTQGIQSTPLNLAVSWRGDTSSTDLRIDYKYNTEALPTPTPLTNIHFMAAVDGGVKKLQAMLPPATWNPETKKIAWKISELSQKSDNGGVGALLARFQLAEGPSRPSQLVVQFTSEGSTLSGCDFQLLGSGYRLSLVKKRFSAGKYFADN
ncbi:hypothetical protein DNTS_002604 [Danionella cerebrum]|uniref:MHD domain-containing protein n=1 Tax=Danionella cerebrum TaxID=2873325 RepID=A0A553R5V4_9TELE|nr:hypothetical protein DNTS_002604 [Danionella translucida]